MSFRSISRPSRLGSAAVALVFLSACTEPLDFDMRGNLGGFSTAAAAQSITTERPQPDERGIISYPNYQVAVARRGDTVGDVAARVGLPTGELARFNGIEPGVTLRDGEIIALPRRVAEPSGANGGVDIETLAGNAIDNAAGADTGAVQTTALAPTAAPKPAAAPTAEPVRHKVVRGETAYTISRLYQVPVKSLGEWNGLGPDFAIREGQYLLIPVTGASPPRRTAAAATELPGTGTPTPTPPSATDPLPDERIDPTPPQAPDVSLDQPSQPASTAAMAFPLQGKIVRTYAKGRNEGISIAAAPGTAVNAAADGTVAAITTSADQVPIVVVRHPDNLLTVYANVANIVVKKGDPVKRGQQLASLRDGDNAYVHFEVRNGFESVDPMPYLE